MLAFVALAIGAAAWSPEGASPEGAGVAHGSATVVDGDTLRIGGESIRLHGIDAPELVQFCADGWLAGDAARRALASRVAAGTPQCERMGIDRYGRTTAVCRVNGEDIGAALVRFGHGVGLRELFLPLPAAGVARPVRPRRRPRAPLRRPGVLARNASLRPIGACIFRAAIAWRRQQRRTA